MYIVSKSLLLLILFHCDIISSIKLRSPGLEIDPLRPNKLNECGRCKTLTDSFTHWLEKTSRGKYEGGDTAWEETKLKSYARSEVRLVEIQEGLCSELKNNQDDCYILAEEVEQVLEKWWFHEDPNSIDLHTWLCIETLKYCCPVNHFGDMCTPCPLDNDNQICSGHGKCNGDGTRKGNGTCICKRGYTGTICEECDFNFYPANGGSCVQCHKACNGCSGEGPTSCLTCKSGWQLESGSCIDIDECSLPSICRTNQYCLNKEGTFKCKSCDISCLTCAGDGVNNCTTCESPNILWNKMCITKEQHSDIVFNTVKKLGLYLGLLIISIIISRTYKYLGTTVILVIAIFIYYHETASNTQDILNILHNVYQMQR